MTFRKILVTLEKQERYREIRKKQWEKKTYKENKKEGMGRKQVSLSAFLSSYTRAHV